MDLTKETNPSRLATVAPGNVATKPVATFGWSRLRLVEYLNSLWLAVAVMNTEPPSPVNSGGKNVNNRAKIQVSVEA